MHNMAFEPDAFSLLRSSAILIASTLSIVLTRLQLEILIEALEEGKYYEQLLTDERYGQINSLKLAMVKLNKAYETVK